LSHEETESSWDLATHWADSGGFVEESDDNSLSSQVKTPALSKPSETELPRLENLLEKIPLSLRRLVQDELRGNFRQVRRLPRS
jgi:hypothetical protein